MARTDLDMAAFRGLLVPKRMLVMQLLQGASGLGCLIFGAIVLGLSCRGGSEVGTGDDSVNSAVMDILTFIHIGYAIVSYSGAYVCYRYVVNYKRLSEQIYFGNLPGDASLEEKSLVLIKTGIIVRIVSLEGVAFFGLVTCLLGATGGVLNEYPKYWVNLFSFVVMMAFVLMTFPTKRRVESIFADRMLDNRL